MGHFRFKDSNNTHSSDGAGRRELPLASTPPASGGAPSINATFAIDRDDEMDQYDSVDVVQFTPGAVIPCQFSLFVATSAPRGW